MQDWPLTVDRVINHAAQAHGHGEVVTRSIEGPIVRTTYAQIHERARRLTGALLALGVRPADRVGTLAWNTARHIEAWYGIMGMGAICHTLNPRLLPSQLAWMADHAGDRVLLADACFAPLMAPVLAGAPGIEHVVWLTDEAHRPDFTPPQGHGLKGVHCVETLIEQADPNQPWGGFDEGTAAGLCYTSGTTGDPKGVLYSHRSNVLHSMMCMQTDVMGISGRETVLAVVPMFHANGWGLPFTGPAIGAKLVMPGPKLDGASLQELIETEQVTYSAAVPTVWGGLLAYLRESGKRIDSLKRVLIGGAAASQSLVEAFRDEYGVEVVCAWGMTETSPLGTVSMPTLRTLGLDPEAQMVKAMKPGRAPFGIELKIEDDAGAELPRDGQTSGRLMVRGPTVARSYFRSDAPILDRDSFFDTGDVATIDDDGFMQITDRAKDVIKSGGEWISSIEIENHALSHTACAAAAVIGIAHPKWNERPLLLVKLRPGATATAADFLDLLKDKIAKWWMPDDVMFVDDIPLNATGKTDKKALRKTLADYVLPSERPAETLAHADPAPTLVAPQPEPAPIRQEPPIEQPAPFPMQEGLPQALAPEAIEAFPATAFVEPPRPPKARPAPLTMRAPPGLDSELWPKLLGRYLKGVLIAGIVGALGSLAVGVLAAGLLDVAYKIEFAVLALAVIGLVASLGLDWKTFGSRASVALAVALIGLGVALVLTAASSPRGQFPAAASGQIAAG
jgi:fatty-acyl-CoA synthase